MQSCLDNIKAYNDYLDLLTAYTNELRERAGDKMLDYFSQLRGFPIETIKQQKIFYIGEASEMLLPNFIDDIGSLGVISNTNAKPIFHNRFVMPIMDSDGRVLNLVGYSKEADERYVYGTAKYYRRKETLYGLENIELAYELGYAFLTEGITDAIRLRSMGYLNTFANCGTHGSKHIQSVLNRCKHGVIKLPDRDAAGLEACRRWTFYRSATCNTYIEFKDVDSMCFNNLYNEHNTATIRLYLDACVDWIKSAEHNCLDCAKADVTIYL